MALTLVCSYYFFEKCLSLPHLRWCPVPHVLRHGLQGFGGNVGTPSPAVGGVPGWRQKAAVSVLSWTEAGTSTFFKCQNHRKAPAGASGLGTRHKGRGNQPLWLLAFAALTARSVESLLILCQCFVGSILMALSLCDVPLQSPSYISG